MLQRWISADPLAVHAPGEADLNLYAYVHGRVLIAVDPVGLDGTAVLTLTVLPELAPAAPYVMVGVCFVGACFVVPVVAPEGTKAGGGFHSAAGDAHEVRQVYNQRRSGALEDSHDNMVGAGQDFRQTEAYHAERIKKEKAQKANSGHVDESSPADPNGDDPKKPKRKPKPAPADPENPWSPKNTDKRRAETQDDLKEKHGADNVTRSEGRSRVEPAPAPRMTAQQATEAATKLGFEPTNYRSSGEPVFRSGNRYITPDRTGHNGGAWKMADSVENLGRRDTRMGTYDANLNRIGD